MDSYLPRTLIENFFERIDDSTTSVLITECEKYDVSSLFSLIKNNPKIDFTLTTYQPAGKENFSLICSQLKNVNLIFANIYDYDFTNEKFDVIFCVPAFGNRMSISEKFFFSKESSFVAVQNLLYRINTNGNLVVILPAKVMFDSDDSIALRKYIGSNYKVKEISSLPEGIFAPHTFIRMYLFVFSTGKTDDVLLKQYEFEKPIRRNVPSENLVLKNELLLFSDEFASLRGWKVDMAFIEEDEDVKAFATSPVKKLCLRDVATVFRGKAISEKSDRGNIAIVNISDITDTGINYDNLALIEEEERKVWRYALEDGDVLVTSRGTAIKVAVFERQSMICIPSANIIVIRAKDMLRGMYLKLFLESSVGMKLLQSLRRSSVVTNLNYRDIMGLEVPVLPIAEQDALIQKYNAGLKEYKETTGSAERKWQSIKQDVQSKLF